MWFGCLPLSDERCHFSSYFMKDEERGRVIGQRACKVKGCQADVDSHLPSLFLHLACLSSSFLLTFSLSHLFSFTLGSGGITDRSQLEPGLKASRDISVIIKPALRLPNTSSLMRAHTHTHTPPGRVKQPLFSQKIDIKKEEEQKIPF